MTIREILDGMDKETEAHRAAIIRIGDMRQRILSCCREEKAQERAKEGPAWPAPRTTKTRKVA